jgi:hypothetical protein
VHQVWTSDMGVGTRASKLCASVSVCSLLQDLGCASPRQFLVHGYLYSSFSVGKVAHVL